MSHWIWSLAALALCSLPLAGQARPIPVSKLSPPAPEVAPQSAPQTPASSTPGAKPPAQPDPEEAARKAREAQLKQVKMQAIQQLMNRLRQHRQPRNAGVVLAARARLALARVADRRAAAFKEEQERLAAEAGEGAAETDTEDAAATDESPASAREGDPKPTQAPAPPAPPKFDTTPFQDLLMAGEWKALREWMTENADAQAGPLYLTALQLLVKQDQVLVPEDVVAISEACPQDELSEAHLTQLGILFGKTLSRGDHRPLLDKLHEGTKWFGGEERESRDRAAELLLRANLIDEANPFLLPLDEAEAPSVQLLNRHGDYASAQAEGAKEVTARRTLQRKAWDLHHRALDHAEITADERQLTIQKLLDLATAMPEEVTSPWRTKLFTDEPDLGLVAFSNLAASMSQGTPNRQPMPTRERARLLTMMSEEANRLTDTIGKDAAQWAEHLSILAQGWLAEVDQHISRSGPAFASNSDGGAIIYWNGRRQGGAISAEELWVARPQSSWMALLPGSLKQRSIIAKARMAARIGETEGGLSMVREAKARSKADAKEVAEAFVDDYRLALNPGTNAYQNQHVYYSGGVRHVYYSGGSGGQSLPITRTQQISSLRALAAFFDSLRELEIWPLEGAPVTNTFAACHSEAEVFRKADIERLMGPVDRLDPAVAGELAERMRKNLADRWRKPAVQRNAKTRRTSQEVLVAVAEGYQLAMQLSEVSARGTDRDPGRLLSRANLQFDLAEFMHAQKAPLDRYTKMRDAAFAGYGMAQDAYQSALTEGTMPRTALFLGQWFLSALGASDLAHATRETKPDDDEIARVRTALDALSAEERFEHCGELAGYFEEMASKAKPVMKPRFVRNAVRLVGDHPKARQLQRIGRVYEDIAREVELAVTIDGSTAVGNGKLFGVRLGLRYTSAIARETGGFDKYLRNQAYFGGTPVNYRDDLERFARDAFKEDFLVENIFFHDANDPTRYFGRPGWLEQPLAYIVLAAKDPAIDRLPSVVFDMDFHDGEGTVIIPIPSEPVLIDATETTPAARPNTDLAVEMTFDNRNLEEKQLLLLEVRMSGKGVLPDFETLLPRDIEGLKFEKLEDNGLNVVELDEEAPLSTPVTERFFTLSYRTTPEFNNRFRFPEPLIDAQVSHRRYADMDIVDAKSEIVLGSKPSSPTRYVPWVLLLLGSWVLVVVAIRRSRAMAEPEVARELPTAVTPLTALQFLAQVRDDAALDDPRANELQRDIESIERAHFAAAKDADSTLDLDAILKRWA